MHRVRTWHLPISFPDLLNLVFLRGPGSAPRIALFSGEEQIRDLKCRERSSSKSDPNHKDLSPISLSPHVLYTAS